MTSELLGIRAQQRRALAWITGLVAVLMLSMAAGVMIGPVPVSPAEVLAVLRTKAAGAGEPYAVATTSAIVWEVRLPRVVLGVCAGAGLAVCGMALQAMVRNVLADPYLLGINSGASSGAAAAILFGVGIGAGLDLGDHALQVSAFIGALTASLLVYGVARTGGRVTGVRLLLAGVAVGYGLYAVTSFLVFASGSPEGSRSVMFWLLGSLTLADWGTPLAAVVVVVLTTAVVLTVGGRKLDALSVGDDTALSLGVHPERLRSVLLLLVSLCIGIVVAASGSIGFVGLVVPHLARRAVGATHVRSVPVAALIGAILLIWADIAARTLLAPQEIPIGILTAVVGTPLLLVLVRRLHATTA